MSKKETVEKFKKRIMDMHRGIPEYRYYGYLEDIIRDEEIRDYFIKNDVFIKSNQKGPNNKNSYFLGVKRLSHN